MEPKYYAFRFGDWTPTPIIIWEYADCCLGNEWQLLKATVFGFPQDFSKTCCFGAFPHMGVSKNSKYPQIIPCLIGFSHYFHHPFWGNYCYHPYFWKQPHLFPGASQGQSYIYKVVGHPDGGGVMMRWDYRLTVFMGSSTLGFLEMRFFNLHQYPWWSTQMLNGTGIYTYLHLPP